MGRREEEGGAYRFDALTGSSPDVYAEDAVASPFAFPREPVETHDVAEGSLDRTAFKVDPVDGSRAVEDCATRGCRDLVGHGWTRLARVARAWRLLCASRRSGW